MQILQFPDSSWGLTVLKNIFLRFIGLKGLKMVWKKSSLIWNFFPWFWLKNPVFPWFPWLEKVFKIFPEFPDRWEPWLGVRGQSEAWVQYSLEATFCHCNFLFSRSKASDANIGIIAFLVHYCVSGNTDAGIGFRPIICLRLTHHWRNDKLSRSQWCWRKRRRQVWTKY